MEGDRDPRALALLDGRAPDHVEEVTWSRPIRVGAYVGAAALPDDLVTSVRCIVRVDDCVVVCTNRHGIAHAMPGGRRKPGETYAETARREVHEETGWWIDTDSVTPLGFLHLFNLGEPLPPYPHPDVLQLVVAAEATERAAEDWSDTDGYELSSRLVALGAAAAGEHHTDADETADVAFLRHLAAAR